MQTYLQQELLSKQLDIKRLESISDTCSNGEDSALQLLSEVNAFVHNSLQQDSESLGDSTGTHELANFGFAKIIK